MRERPCMLCNQPMDNGVCHTLGCAYNPEAEGQVHEAEWNYDEKLHQEIGEFDPEDLPHHEHEGEPDDDFVHLPDTEGLEGKFEDEPIHADDLTQEQRDQRQAPKGEKPKDDRLDNKINQDAEDADDRMGGGEQGQDNQLTEEDKGEDPSDDAHDLPEGQQDEDEGDPDLPPRPRGCNGDCQPGELGEDGDPCPHCTAKSFQQEMEQQGKQHQPPEEMEKDWQDFLDNWQDMAPEQGQGQGDQGDEQMKPEMEEILDQMDEDDQKLGEQKLEDRQAPDLDGDDDDLPPKPQGCDGNCQPADQYDMDSDPCPHCTAKSFRDDMREQEKEADMQFGKKDLDEMFQDFLKDWENQQDKAKDAPEEKPEQDPEEIDEAPPEDEMQDGMPKEKPEKQVPEHEDEDPDEFKRVAQKMTVTQEKRFDNIVERIEKKVEATFGQTAEDIFVQAKQEGQFKGEEVSQTIQVTSRGVTFWVTISAAKEI